MKKLIVRHIKNTSKCLKKHTCKYYRAMGEAFDLRHLGPKGLCLDLYFSAYPYCLSLLYGAKFTWEKDKNAVNAQCPVPEGNAHFKVFRQRLEKPVISNGIKKRCKVFIQITRVEKTSNRYRNNCKCFHKIGQKFEFNQGDDLAQMCPAAFYSAYPAIKSILGGGRPAWLKSGKTYFQCPDNISAIMFEIGPGKR